MIVLIGTGVLKVRCTRDSGSLGAAITILVAVTIGTGMVAKVLGDRKSAARQ